MDLATIKTRLRISTVLQHYQLQADKNGMLCCPFHPDKNPSMKVYSDTDTVYCFSGNCETHGHSIDAVDFVMRMDNLSKHEAIIKAGELCGAVVPVGKPPKAQSGIAKTQPATDFVEYQAQLMRNKRAKAYCAQRGLDPVRLDIGYKNQKAAGKWGRGCVIFGLRNDQEEVVSLYGRSIVGDSHYYSSARQGLYPCYPDPGTQKLILTECIIDAATLLLGLGRSRKTGMQSEPETSILALYGTNGLTKEHRAVIASLEHLHEIIFFLDGDEAGEKAVQKYSKELAELRPTIMISQVATPANEDLNSLWQRSEERGETAKLRELTDLIQTRQTLFSPPPCGISLRSTDKIKSNGVLNTKNPNRLIYQGSTARYQVMGGLRRELDNLKVTLSIEHEGQRSRQKLDLFEDIQVEKAAKRAGEKLSLRPDLLELDLNRLTDLLEDYRENELQADNTPTKPQLSPAEAQVARHFLSTPKLMHRLNEALGKAGVVGEERNRLFLFCCASSYKQQKPLHVLSQGASGMGKTHAQEVIAACLPEEEVIEITRMTDYSFYNYGERELSHKVLFIEDMDSLSEEAMLALREMQSKGRITLSTTRKDEQGNLKAGRKTVYGPLATVGATTKGGLYEDNAGRCFILAVDESMEQTRRIIHYQNELAGGKIDLVEQREARRLLQNCVRLLDPAEVVNPYAARVNLPEEAHKLRRLNGFFNGLIAQITWLHQLQRKRDKLGRLIAEESDVRLGIELFLDALVWKIDELDGSLRGFYERLKDYVRREGGEQYEGYRFGQREIRLALRVSKTQLQRYLFNLEELEYIYLASSNRGKGYRYQIAWWDDAEAMRARIRNHLLNQIDPNRPGENGSV